MTKASNKILHHCFFYIFSDIKKKEMELKWNSHKEHYNYGDFVSTKHFPVNGVP